MSKRSLIAVVVAISLDLSNAMWSSSCGEIRAEEARHSMSPSSAIAAQSDAKLPFALVKNGAAATADTPTPLRRPTKDVDAGDSRVAGGKKSSSITTVLSSLAIVLGMFALFAWFAKRSQKKGSSGLPSEAVETLGRVPLNAKQEMHLVRIGNKLLLLAVTANSAETLTEITDPTEIDRLTGICLQGQSGGLGATLRDVMSHLGTNGGDYRYPARG